MKTRITAAALLSAAAIVCQEPGVRRAGEAGAQQPQPPALENSRWHVTATPAAVKRAEGEEGDTDTDEELVDALLFGNGMVASSAHGPKGFGAAAYTLTSKDGKWLLAARQVGAKQGGEVTWSCEIAADKISGTMVCKSKSGAIESFKLTGMRAPALEATSWLIKITGTSQEAAPGEDTMLFIGHKMTSKEAKAKGFSMCAFSLVPDADGVWALGAVQYNAKEKTRLVWAGEVKGDTIKGMLTAFDTQGEVTAERAFEGARTNKPVRVKKKDGKRKKPSKDKDKDK